MRTYELMIIHRPELAESDVRTAISQLEETLTGQGAEMVESDFWGKRRFAYEIDHINEGFYTVLTFRSDPEPVDLVDRALSLSDAVVRHKVLRLAHLENVSQA